MCIRDSGEHDHPTVLGLITLGNVVVRNLFAVDAADSLVPDPTAVRSVHLAELHFMVLRGRIEPHRHIDQAEGHRALPYGTHDQLTRPFIRSLFLSLSGLSSCPLRQFPRTSGWIHAPHVG